jgi:hypothetical protein
VNLFKTVGVCEPLEQNVRGNVLCIKVWYLACFYSLLQNIVLILYLMLQAYLANMTGKVQCLRTETVEDQIVIHIV